jgi:hypothetical protein
MVFLCWFAKNDTRLLHEQIDEYNQRMRTILPETIGLRAVVASLDGDIHDRFSTLILKMMEWDGAIALAASQFREDDPTTAKHLSKLYEDISAVENSLPDSIANALSPLAVKAAQMDVEGS